MVNTCFQKLHFCTLWSLFGSLLWVFLGRSVYIKGALLENGATTSDTKEKFHSLVASPPHVNHKSQLSLDHTGNSHKELWLQFGEGEHKQTLSSDSFFLSHLQNNPFPAFQPEVLFT